jgi:hypothetical protein
MSSSELKPWRIIYTAIGEPPRQVAQYRKRSEAEAHAKLLKPQVNGSVEITWSRADLIRSE